MKMLQALIMEQKEELAKLHIEHPAAVKVHNAAVEQMMKAVHIESARRQTMHIVLLKKLVRA